ncbi:retrovirus-related pol polyprotein from type-1 retrotransposable element r2 [Plakobranchus ocellatus]|uniref:Retrovirus-related pol polyprotein from type-1 retrotransposable element r2 n=1 Tax=Plakobranchus ocellatus TaxID=259542 RepID=A0AAV4BW85_9GAST|nr:retrovirus-related pol polyprotein from type-1 retrotransposable element r2 [Plakobranchus ocellatus]
MVLYDIAHLHTCIYTRCGLVKSLYEGQQSAVQLEYGTTEWFPVTKGVRQGCILSPHLFSLYTEEIMRDVEFDPRKDEYDEPRLQGLPIRDLRYTDDTALLSTTTEGLEKLIKAVKEHSEQKGLHLNVKKTKIMDIDKCKKEARIQIEGEEIERVKSFEYLGARIEANGKTTPEIRRRLAMATAKLQKMEKIWKGQDVHTKSIKKLKLTYFEHIKRHQTLEKHILEAKMKGKRGKGRPTRRWENDIEEWLETSTSQAGRLTSDRETFRRRVQEATSRNG